MAGFYAAVDRLKSLSALLVAATTLIIGITAAQANPVATTTVKNNWTAPAVYSAALSDCSGNTVSPAFATIPQSQTGGPYTVASGTATTLSCKLYYSASSKSCRFVVSRLTTQTCNPLTGVCTQTWNYPQVNVTAGGGATCNYSFTSVSDTNAAVTSTNGKFSVTLTNQ